MQKKFVSQFLTCVNHLEIMETALLAIKAMILKMVNVFILNQTMLVLQIWDAVPGTGKTKFA